MSILRLGIFGSGVIMRLQFGDVFFAAFRDDNESNFELEEGCNLN